MRRSQSCRRLLSSPLALPPSSSPAVPGLRAREVLLPTQRLVSAQPVEALRRAVVMIQALGLPGIPQSASAQGSRKASCASSARSEVAEDAYKGGDNPRAIFANAFYCLA
jgi:hypothetical protein